MKILSLLTVLFFLIACSQSISTSSIDDQSEIISKKNVITQSEISKDTIKDFANLPNDIWKQILSPEEFYILREKGTERPFSGKYNDNKKRGIYLCKGCKTELFSSDSKFDSGTGWPSFYDEIENNVEEKKDNSHGMQRIELICTTCKGHLGHVFNDGPKPTGLRYCINSLSLDFKEQ